MAADARRLRESMMSSTTEGNAAADVISVTIAQAASSKQIIIHGFGVVFQPRTFSAQDLSTSELLRTL